jgi:hypothetical protein
MYILNYIRKGNKVQLFDLQSELTSFLQKNGQSKYCLTQKMINKIINKKYHFFNEYIDMLYQTQLNNYHVFNHYMNQNQLEIPYEVLRTKFKTTTTYQKNHIYNYEIIRDFYHDLGVVYFLIFSKKENKTLVNYQFNPIYLEEFEEVNDVFSTVKYKSYISNNTTLTTSNIDSYINSNFVKSNQNGIKIDINNCTHDQLYRKLASIIENDISLNADATYEEILEYYENRTPIKTEKVWYNFHDNKSKLYFKYHKQYLRGFKLDYYLSEVYCFGDNSWVSCKNNGRFYSSITNLPSLIRKHILIDGEPVLEIDAANSQPHLLNSVIDRYITDNNLNLNQDEIDEVNKYRELTSSGELYDYLKKCYIDHYELNKKGKFPKNNLALQVNKSLFKMEVIASIFFSRDYQKKQPNKLIVNNPLKNIFRANFPFISEIINKFKQVDYKSLAVELQRIEVELIIHQCSKQLLGNDIKVITIHDGFLVKQSDYDKALDIVKSVYSKNNLTATFKNKMIDISTGSDDVAAKIAA